MGKRCMLLSREMTCLDITCTWTVTPGDHNMSDSVCVAGLLIAYLIKVHVSVAHVIAACIDVIVLRDTSELILSKAGHLTNSLV